LGTFLPFFRTFESRSPVSVHRDRPAYVDSVLSRQWRFNDYKSNYKDWEAELTAAVGLSVWVGSLDPDLSPSVASSCANGPEDVTPTGGSTEREVQSRRRDLSVTLHCNVHL
jgi:hypothetical protein